MAIDRGVRLISYLKFFKGTLLLISGFGLLKILNTDSNAVIMQCFNALHVDPANRHVQNILFRASFVDDRQWKVLSVGSFFFAGLSLTEGSALLLQKRWAKYFTVVVTASLVPLELWDTMGKFSTVKGAVIAINVAVVWYLVARIRRERMKPGEH